jgi:hypothetical protein
VFGIGSVLAIQGAATALTGPLAIASIGAVSAISVAAIRYASAVNRKSDGTVVATLSQDGTNGPFIDPFPFHDSRIDGYSTIP